MSPEEILKKFPQVEIEEYVIYCKDAATYEAVLAAVLGTFDLADELPWSVLRKIELSEKPSSVGQFVLLPSNTSFEESDSEVGVVTHRDITNNLYGYHVIQPMINSRDSLRMFRLKDAFYSQEGFYRILTAKEAEDMLVRRIDQQKSEAIKRLQSSTNECLRTLPNFLAEFSEKEPKTIETIDVAEFE